MEKRALGTLGDLIDLYVADLETDGKRTAAEVRRVKGKDIPAVVATVGVSGLLGSPASTHRGHPVAARLPPNDGQLHVLNLDADQQEVNFSQYSVLQVIDTLLVFEFKKQNVVAF